MTDTSETDQADVPSRALVRDILSGQDVDYFLAPAPLGDGAPSGDVDATVHEYEEICRTLLTMIQEMSLLTRDDVLDLIGCTERSGPYKVEHLRVAVRLLQDLASATEELWYICEDKKRVGDAFRRNGVARSRRNEMWHTIFFDAVATVSEDVIPDEVVSPSPAYSGAVLELRRLARLR